MIKIRNIQKKDADACMDLEWECFDDNYNTKDISKDTIHLLNESLVAVDSLNDDKIVGACITYIDFQEYFSSALKEYLFEPESKMLLTHISLLAVTKEYRNKKIGQQLIEKTIENVRAHSNVVILEVSSQNPNAVRFYEKMGFIRYNTLKNYYHTDDGNVDGYLMIKYI